MQAYAIALNETTWFRLKGYVFLEKLITCIVIFLVIKFYGAKVEWYTLIGNYLYCELHITRGELVADTRLVVNVVSYPKTAITVHCTITAIHRKAYCQTTKTVRILTAKQ